VFLIYSCTTDGRDPVINEEFDAFAWIAPDECDRYDMNEEIRIMLRQLGVISGAATPLTSDLSKP